MKRSIIFLFALVFSCSGLFVSCSKKDPKTCASWYEGANCTTEMRQKFYGTYTGTATEPGGGHFQATATFSAGTGGIQNIHVLWGGDVSGVIWNISLSGSTTVTVPSQEVNNNPLTPGVIYSDLGSGTLNDNSLTLTWTSSNANGAFHWTFIGNK